MGLPFNFPHGRSFSTGRPSLAVLWRTRGFPDCEADRGSPSYTAYHPSECCLRDVPFVGCPVFGGMGESSQNRVVMMRC